MAAVALDPAETAAAWHAALASGDVDTAWRLTSPNGRLSAAVAFAVDTERTGTTNGSLAVFDLATDGRRHRWWWPLVEWLTANHTVPLDILDVIDWHENERPDWPDGWAEVAATCEHAPGVGFTVAVERTAAGWRVGSFTGEPFADTARDFRRRRAGILAARRAKK